MSGIREIAMTEMPEVSIGNVQNEEAKTGVTVLLFDKKTGAVVGVDISGGGPASRETPLTSRLQQITRSMRLFYPVDRLTVWQHRTV